MICIICKEDKALDEFSWKNKNKEIKSRECKECHKKIRNIYYQNNKEKEKQRTSIVKKKYRQWFKDLKMTFKCSKCSEDHISCLDFHHIDPKEKEFNLSQALNRGIGKEKLLKEIEKCIILCANCHRKEHYKE